MTLPSSFPRRRGSRSIEQVYKPHQRGLVNGFPPSPREVLIKGVISTEAERSISQYIENKDLSTSLKMTNGVKWR